MNVLFLIIRVKIWVSRRDNNKWAGYLQNLILLKLLCICINYILHNDFRISLKNTNYTFLHLLVGNLNSLDRNKKLPFCHQRKKTIDMEIMTEGTFDSSILMLICNLSKFIICKWLILSSFLVCPQNEGSFRKRTLGKWKKGSRSIKMVDALRRAYSNCIS